MIESTEPLTTCAAAYAWNQGQISVLAGPHAEQIARLNQLDRMTYKAFVEVYRRASLILWLDDIRMAAISGYEHFKGHELDRSALDPPIQLWINSTDVEFTEQQGAVLRAWKIPENFTVASVLVFITPANTLRSWFLFGCDAESINNLPTGEEIETFRQTRIFPERFLPRIRMSDQSLVAQDDIGAKIHAMIEFMNLPLVELRRDRLLRPERRRIQKAGGVEPDLRVIILRRKESDGAGPASLQRDVDWSCRWIVGGHWRKQWYPGEQQHKPIFIAPYVKGPEGRPLKAPAEKIFKVAR